MNIPVNKWTIGIAVTVLAWICAWGGLQQKGDYDFGPAIVGAVLLIGTLALWVGLVAGHFL